ncbi:Sulfate permease [hydrothermal vent metagenome]|uniref:Sulfate permease n=1 Tax=hydrothermal vent metagenome TaxID=652676 RepID=A0A3B1BUG0_9ZZZZ
MENKYINKLLPFLSWLPLVNRSTLKSDLVAGITNAFIVLPQGVAFAMIAGLPPEYGLYSAIIPPIIAALFGSSLHLISGPTTAISIVLFSTISPYAEPGSGEFIQLALTLTFMTGLIQFTLGVLRFGTIVNFISHTVVVGFTTGAAMLIATSQIKHCLGVDIPAGESFLHTWIDVFVKLPETNFYVLSVASVTLIIVVGMKVYNPKLPGMLVAMVAAGLVAYFLGAEEHAIRVVGSLPSHLPPFSMPDFDAKTIRVLAPGSLAVAMLGLIEAVSIARSIAIKSKQRIDGNQEFTGQGVANIFGSFFSCYASSGSFTRSGINYSAGAKTPMAAIFAAISLAAILFIVAPLAAYLPIPAMGGIVLVVAYNLIDFHHIKSILRSGGHETSVLVVTFLATLFLELEFAIYAGVILSLILYLHNTSKPRIVSRIPDIESSNRSFITNTDLPECPQFKIIRIDNSIYFGSVNRVQQYFEHLRSKSSNQKYVLVVCSGINFIDIAGAEMLANEAKEWRFRGGGLYLYGMKHKVRSLLKKGGYLDVIGEENIFSSKSAAIRAIYEKLDKDICKTCPETIFTECKLTPKTSGVTVNDNKLSLPV